MLLLPAGNAAQSQGSAGDLAGGLGGLNLGAQQRVPQQLQQQPQQQQQPQDDFFGLSQSSSAPAPAAAPPLPVLVPADKGKGLTISGRLAREGGQIGAHLYAACSHAPQCGISVKMHDLHCAC